MRSIVKNSHEVRTSRPSERGVRVPHRVRSEIGDGEPVFEVQFAWPAVVGEAGRDVRRFLHLDQRQPCANRVHRPGGHQERVARGRRPPRHEFLDGPLRAASLASSGASARVNPRPSSAGGVAPRTCHASVLPADWWCRRAVLVVRVHLNRESLGGEQELQQQRFVAGEGPRAEHGLRVPVDHLAEGRAE